MASFPRNKLVSNLDGVWGRVSYLRMASLEEEGLVRLAELPYSIRVLLENALRHLETGVTTEDDVLAVADWSGKGRSHGEFPFMPARVLMQDLTGVPAVVDLASLRSAMARGGKNPRKINPSVPVDLVIDHSVQVDYFGTPMAFQLNVEREFERNRERYMFLRWAQKAFDNFRVVPPGTGIVHQVNLEYLATVVATKQVGSAMIAFPDTLVGTDSHTTMINGLGVLGWGVGGIEAEAVLLEQPYYMQLPEVVGFKLTGRLRDGVTATDLVLTVTQILRQKGVVEKFVEFYGAGLSQLPVPDRATIANMAPEYGATCGFFPVDHHTVEYLRNSGRAQEQVELVEQYAKAQGLFRTDDTPDPIFSDVLSLDLDSVEPSVAGPRRPQDRVLLRDVKTNFAKSYEKELSAAPAGLHIEVELDGQRVPLGHGSVAIAAITSCTNTSNPSVMLGAGLLAKKAVERGLMRKPWVKSSMAPGSQVVTAYLEAAGLTPYLEQLGFYTVGYGCTTCIGNSGPLEEPISAAIAEHDLNVAAVLSGNRNFEGRIHPDVKANYLASPLLVIAYALTGTVETDLTNEPIGYDGAGEAVFLSDIWPSQAEINEATSRSMDADMFRERYGQVFQGTEEWRGLPVPEGDLYDWDAQSTYIREAPYFEAGRAPAPVDIVGGRVLVMVGDSITTDHISPAGAIPASRPAGDYLLAQGVQRRDFNTFGARRGNHEVMVRGTFGNPRLQNKLTPDREGDWTLHLPEGEAMSIFDGATKYVNEGVPLIIIAGKEYGAGSSRDWAAKGPMLLGVRAVIAESYERIHRSNLVGMGVLPLQFKQGESPATLGLTGRELFDIRGVAAGIRPGQEFTLRATREDGSNVEFNAIVRIDNEVEIDYYRHGGLLPVVLARMMEE